MLGYDKAGRLGIQASAASTFFVRTAQSVAYVVQLQASRHCSTPVVIERQKHMRIGTASSKAAAGVLADPGAAAEP